VAAEPHKYRIKEMFCLERKGLYVWPLNSKGGATMIKLSRIMRAQLSCYYIFYINDSICITSKIEGSPCISKSFL